jgi:Short-chain dehydrogenases of various substrate specificities
MKALFIGASSDLAIATEEEFAKNGFELFLIARNKDKLEEIANHINVISSKKPSTYVCDLTDYDSLEKIMDEIFSENIIDVVLIFQGYLPKDSYDKKEILNTIDVNYTSCVMSANFAVKYFLKQHHGMLIGVSSVAGDRARPSNSLYGSSKAGFSFYLEGLRYCMASKNIHVMSVKPGFIKTKMTKDISFPKLFSRRKRDCGKRYIRCYAKEKRCSLYTFFLRVYNKSFKTCAIFFNEKTR